MTYALLIYRSTPLSEPLPELEERLALEGHRAVQKEASAQRQLHAVARLGDSKRARVVRRKAGGHDVTDGPFIETKEWLVGFYLVDCVSEEQAIERACAICVDGVHSIEVRPVTWRWKS
jgi:hypothetical protein